MDEFNLFDTIIAYTNHHSAEKSQNTFLASLSKVQIRALLLTIQKLCNKQETEVNKDENTSIHGEMICFLMSNCFNFWSNFGERNFWFVIFGKQCFFGLVTV